MLCAVRHLKDKQAPEVNLAAPQAVQQGGSETSAATDHSVLCVLPAVPTRVARPLHSKPVPSLALASHQRPLSPVAVRPA